MNYQISHDNEIPNNGPQLSRRSYATKPTDIGFVFFKNEVTKDIEQNNTDRVSLHLTIHRLLIKNVAFTVFNTELVKFWVDFVVSDHYLLTSLN